MIYCDTSLLVPLLTPERFSEEAELWFRRQPLVGLAVSPWTSTEIASALATKERSGVLDRGQRAVAFESWVRLSRTMALHAVATEDFHDAVPMVDQGRGLRASDALHLAIAARLGCAVATFDRGMIAAARAIGIEVRFGPPRLDSEPETSY